MNSLQLWLAIVGGLVLAAVVGHGAWQTRRAAGRTGRAAAAAPAASPEAAAPLAEPVHREPTFEADVPTTQPFAFQDRGDAHPADTAEAAPVAIAVAPVPAPAPAPAAIEERLSAVPPALSQPPRRVSTGVARIDALIDAIAAIVPEQPLAGDTVLAHLPPSRRAGAKSFLVEGLNVQTGEWEHPVAGASYGELQAGLQLVNRLGPLNEIEYSEFVQKIQAYADTLGAAVDFPDMLDVVARARSLDHIAVHHDAQLAMRLHARRGNWPLAWVQQNAARHGFVNGLTPGRMILPGRGEGVPPVLELTFDAQAALADDPASVWVDELSLLFDVPQTPRTDQPFNAWCASGQAMALALDADLTDDEGQPLNAESFKLIREDLDGLYDKLAEFELPAGSPATRRLFS